MSIKIYTVAFLALILSLGLSAQNQTEEIIFKAMTDEMSRNLTGLKLDQNPTPFFIADYFTDSKLLMLKASLGGLIMSIETPTRQSNCRLMIGDYSVNDENFVSGTRNYNSGGVQLALPKEDDYMGIRRSFWTMFDRSYKTSIDNYFQKLTAIKQQNKDDNEKLDDYTRMSPIVAIQPSIPNEYDKTQWENNIKQLSAIFSSYPGIQTSSVDMIVFSSDNYLVNSEGTKVKSPMNIAGVVVNASTLAADGEALHDFVFCYAPIVNQLPAMSVMSDKIKKMAEGLQNRVKSVAINEAYQGLVVIEDEALAELFNSKLFGNDGLIANREPLYADVASRAQTNKIENKIGKRLCNENISITATPKVTKFGATPLIGSFTIDAEGVIPADTLKLVDKGILETLLNDRVPTAKVKESNGHDRFVTWRNNLKSPGVINVSYDNGTSYANLIKHVSDETIKNGLDYFYIIRKFDTPGFGQYIQPTSSGLTKPICMVKVMAKTGEELVVRCANVSEFPLLSFKYALGGTTEQVACNTVSQLVSISYIVPKAMAFNDISIEKDNSPKSKQPVVPNPLAGK